MRYVTMDGSRIKTVEENHTRFVSDKKEIEAVIAYIAKTAQAAGIEKQPSPWKTELPDLFSWKKLPVEGSFDGEKWEMTELHGYRCRLVYLTGRSFRCREYSIWTS